MLVGVENCFREAKKGEKCVILPCAGSRGTGCPRRIRAPERHDLTHCSWIRWTWLSWCQRLGLNEWSYTICSYYRETSFQNSFEELPKSFQIGSYSSWTKVGAKDSEQGTADDLYTVSLTPPKAKQSFHGHLGIVTFVTLRTRINSLQAVLS